MSVNWLNGLTIYIYIYIYIAIDNENIAQTYFVVDSQKCGYYLSELNLPTSPSNLKVVRALIPYVTYTKFCTSLGFPSPIGWRVTI
jgi:hypothetical protein